MLTYVDYSSNGLTTMNTSPGLENLINLQPYDEIMGTPE